MVEYSADLDSIGGVAIGDSVRTIDIVVVAMGGSLLLTLLTTRQTRVLLLWVMNGQPQACKVNALVAPKEESTEAGLGEKIKNAVEDSFRIGSNDIATLG